MDVPWPQTTIVRESSPPPFYWLAQPAGADAQLLTLFCRSCEGAAPSGTQARADLPLIAVLRDTLGDENDGNDRITYVWLLSYSRPTIGQHLLSAVPFFYWRVGQGSSHVSKSDIKPFFNLRTPEHPVWAEVSRSIVQYSALDPMVMPVRASTRAYRTNGTNYERLRLEETISYLRQAPSSTSPSELSSAEMNTVIARLELRKKLLGGLVNERRAAKLGEQAGFEQERNRSRNWELLRLSAERAGLEFEPITLGGVANEYAVLRFTSKDGAAEPTGSDLSTVWKLLGIKNPWHDTRLAGPKEHTPLAFYSLNYPNQPLLLIDFRDKARTRRHEMTQRSINEITSGVIGLSHFTNWYYYVAADLYDFISSRHGRAMNQAERLDCYSQFRASLALDRELDPELRKQMLERVDSLSLNPLGAAKTQEMEAAQQRYALLEEAASEPDGSLAKRLDKERRAEIASIGRTGKGKFLSGALHAATLGLYTKRAPQDEGNLARLDSYRRVEHNLNFLDSLAAAGTPPEITYQPARIQSSLDELTRLLPQISSPQVRAHAERTLARVRDLSHNPTLAASIAEAKQ